MYHYRFLRNSILLFLLTEWKSTKVTRMYCHHIYVVTYTSQMLLIIIYCFDLLWHFCNHNAFCSIASWRHPHCYQSMSACKCIHSAQTTTAQIAITVLLTNNNHTNNNRTNNHTSYSGKIGVKKRTLVLEWIDGTALPSLIIVFKWCWDKDWVCLWLKMVFNYMAALGDVLPA